MALDEFQKMFRDYAQELKDVEHQRVDQVEAAQNKWEAQRQGITQQVPDADSERRMWLQFDYDNSFGNEAAEIGKINKDAEDRKAGIEGDREANEQSRIEATGLKIDPGPAPGPAAPANANAFGAVPPDSPQPPKEPTKEEARESQQAQERGTFM